MGRTQEFHQVFLSATQNAPSNGWEHWHIINRETRERVVIDQLRETMIKRRHSADE